MLSLLIETSTERGCIAILRDQELVCFKELPFGLTNSQHLLPEIEKMLKTSGITPRQLQFITAGIGPGSYTGIRVGVMVAKAFAYALKIPLVGVSSLEGFVPSSIGNYAAIIDAKIGGVYLLLGQKTLEGTQLISPPQLIPLDQLKTKLSSIEILVTPNSSVIRPKIEKLGSWLWEEKGVDPVQMTRSALKKKATGDISLDGKLELLYLRKTQAEIEKESKHFPVDK